MKAVRVNQRGDVTVLKLEDIPKPIPKKGQALIKLKAAGLNFIDIYMRKGDPSVPVPLPFTAGMEGAGVVEEIGEEVTEVKPGERVAYAGSLGSYAEYAVVKAAHLIPLPNEISFEQGAALALQGLTAHYLVHDYYSAKPGNTILVHAAAGGVGLLLVQWFTHLGCHVIGTVSTEKKADIAQKAGAKTVINYTQKDFVEETKKITKGRGVDYIIDGVGKSTFLKDLQAVRIRGCICVFGFSSGPADPITPNALQPKSITLCGGNLTNYIQERSELLRRAEAVFKGIKEGWLKLNIDQIYNLEQAGEAQKRLEGRQTSGKVILKIG